MNARNQLLQASVKLVATILAVSILVLAVIEGTSSFPWAVPLFVLTVGGRVALGIAFRRQPRRQTEQLAETEDVAGEPPNIFQPRRRKIVIQTIAASSVFAAFAVATAIFAIAYPPFRFPGILLSALYIVLIAALLIGLRVGLGRAYLRRVDDSSPDN